MKIKKMIMILTLIGITIPHGSLLTAETSLGWGNYVKKAREFSTEEQEIMKEVMPTIVRKMAYAALAGLVLAVVTKPAEKILKKGVSFIPILRWFYLDDDDDENETSSANNAYERERPKKTLDKDIADKKLPLKMEKILKRTRRGFAPRKAILLHGPTKVGKSTYAEVFGDEIAKRTGKSVSMYKASGADFLSKYVGMTPRKIKNLGKNADWGSRSYIKRAIGFAVNNTLGKLIGADLVNGNAVVIFIDEIDALFTGRKGESDYGFAASEALQIVLDRYVRDNPNVYFICTTNYTSNIPRPILSRCELIYIDNPSEEGRKSLVKHYIKNFALEYLKTNINIDSEEMKDMIERVARETEGMNVEDMIDICYDATYFVDEDPVHIIDAINRRRNNGQKRYTWSEFQRAIRDKQEEKERLKESEEQEDINRNRNINALLSRHHDAQYKTQIQKRLIKKKEKRKKTIVGDILQNIVEDNIITMDSTNPAAKKKTIIT